MTAGRYRSGALFIVLAFLTSVSAWSALPMRADGKELPSLAPMLEEVTPAVVNIATEGRVRVQSPLFADPLFRRFFGVPDRPIERKTQSLGSGVIVDAKRGLVLTNHHVIANAVQITVTLRDGRHFEAEIVGSDPETDVAVIRIPAENLKDIPAADSDQLRVGDFVVAIGNPFGLGQTVTSGIVSALGRSGLGIEGYEDFIQTDASINPGNSGGALVNLAGELVGINTAIFSQTGGNIGIGFAIPINLALQITEQLVETGKVERGFIGVTVQTLDANLASAFGIKNQRGAVISSVLEGSPAEKAGLQPGDVVVEIDGRAVRHAGDVRNHIGLRRVGEKVKFEVVRNGKRRSFTVEVAQPRETSAGRPDAVNPRLEGVTLSDIDPDHPLYGRTQGVVVVDIETGTRAWQGGLREGDVITSVNRQDVRNMKEFLAAVDGKEGALLLRVIRGNAAAFLIIK